MSAVGLLYVGAVLFINGLLLLGRLTPREAAPMNLFVGALQVLTPTALILMSGGDQRVILDASGLYLFGFTYLWVGINAVKDWSNHGLGWFSLFVALAAVVFAVDNFVTVGDPAFGVIWLVWAVLWFLFFLVLGLDMASLGAPTGAFTVVVAFVTAAIPAFLLLLGHWTGSAAVATAVALISLVALGTMPRLGAALAATGEEVAAA